MLQLDNHHSQSVIAKIKKLAKRPWVIVLLITLALIGQVILLGRLVYGDIPNFSVDHSQVNSLYAWGPQQFGSPVRQSLNTLRDTFILFFARFDFAFYFIKYILPIILVPLVYYFVLHRLGIRNRFALIAGSLFPLFTPIVFGDFLTGQTFWIYLTVPFVFYYSILLFCWKQFSIKNSLLLSVWLFLSLGMLPPIIVPLFAAVGLLAGVMFLIHLREEGWRLIGKYAFFGSIIGIVFFLLSAPYVLVASSGQAAYTPPSLLGDYYHNYASSNLINTFRMAGNNGSGQNTLGYNQVSIVAAMGILLLIAIFVGTIIIGFHKHIRRYQLMIVGLFTVLLAVLAFMHILNTSPLIGVKVFESQWLVSTVRNPSKLYVIMLPIFVLLFSFALQFYFMRFRGRIPATLIGLGTVVLVCGYGWPALRGDLGLLHGREDKLSSYHASPTIKDIISHIDNRDSRSLLIPASHHDELNYQFMAPGFNILGLEGSLPHTSDLTKNIKSTFNNRNPYFFNYLQTAGIKNIFIQKDPEAYKKSLFSLFSVTLSPEQAKNFASSGLRLAGETNSAWHFKNDHANQLVYSPTNIITADKANSFQAKVPFFAENTAIPTKNSSDYKPYATSYRVQDTLANNERIVSGKAQLHDPSLLLVNLYGLDEGGKRFVVFDILDPLTQQLEKSIRNEVAPNSQILHIGEERYIFSSQKQRIALRAGEYEAVVGSFQSIGVGTDPSFESSLPKLTDSSPEDPGKQLLYTKRSNERTKGKSSLLLGSGGHIGYLSKDLQLQDPKAMYMVSFDYKNIKGKALTFDIIQGGLSLLPNSGNLGSSLNWQTQTIFFQPDSNNISPSQLHFYIEGSADSISENLVDNLQLFKVNEDKKLQIVLPSFPPDVDLVDYSHQHASADAATNLINNGSFEDSKLWGKVGDATAGASGKAEISAKQVNNAADGNYALELSSSNHTAFVAKAIPNFKRNNVYKLSFSYRHISGRKPSFAIWQSGAEIARPSQELASSDKDWTYFETYFVPDKDATGLTLYLYSRSIGDKTINLFDDITIHPTSLVATYFSKQQDPQEKPTNIVKSFQRKNPTEITIEANPGRGMVVLNESYHKGWQAYIQPKNSPAKLLSTHTEVNGFANSWWVDTSRYPDIKNESYTIILRYEPQKFLSYGLISTAVTALAIGGYLYFITYRKQIDARRK